jgi:hypothetical protein
MIRARIKPAVLGVLLASTLGFAGSYLTYDSLPTYPMSTPSPAAVTKQPLGPTLPPQVTKSQATGTNIASVAPEPVKSAAEPPTPAAAPKSEATSPTAPTNAKTSRQGADRNTALQVDLNSYVLAAVNSFQGKHYPYLLNDDYAHYNGVTQNIYYQGSLLLRADPGGSHASYCVGITFETFFMAMQVRNRDAGLAMDDFNGMNFHDLQEFMLLWYAATGPKSGSNPAVAVVKFGIGRRVANWEAAKPGDFIDFSRTNGTGHSVVFLNWIRQNGKIAGFRYWSSQSSTNGLGYKEEYFSDAGGQVMPAGFYIAHVGPIASYRNF